MQLTDYAQALGAAQRLVPSYDGQRMDQLQIQQQQLQNRQAQQQIAAVDAQDQEHQAFQKAFVDLGDSPSADKIRMLGVRFPSISKGLNDAVSGMEKGKRQQVITDTAQIHAALTANRPDLAKSLVQRHIDADKAAGNEPDPEDTALIGMIDSGDATQIKAAKGMLYATLAAADPDSAAKTIGEYGGGQPVKGTVVGRAVGHYDASGTWVTDYRDPDPVEYKSVGPGETLVEVGGNAGGGGQASGGGAAGGSGQPRNVRNKNPGNIIDSPFAKSQPGYVGSDGRFAIFDSAESGQKAQGALLGSYIDRGFNTVGKIINRWAPPSENNTGAYVASVARELGVSPSDTLTKAAVPRLMAAIARVEGGPGSSSAGVAGGTASGGARIVAQGAPKQGYRVMTPAENQSAGLDPNVRYQMGPEGQITALGGQSKAQLKPLPQSVAKEIITNRGTLRQIENAITELAKHPDAIGWGTGKLGDWYTNNWSDPKGVAARAAIGKIGGQIIHDVSGAAVTLSEEPRFRPYVPLITDSPPVARQKLQQLRSLAQGVLSDYSDQYSEEQGYRPFAGKRDVPVSKAKAPPAVGSVVRGYRYNGGNPASPNSWSRAK